MSVVVDCHLCKYGDPLVYLTGVYIRYLFFKNRFFRFCFEIYAMYFYELSILLFTEMNC